jgi:hypothetical protein
MKTWHWLATAAAIIATVAVLFHVKQAPAQQTNLGPIETDLSIGNSATMAAVGANPSRRGLIICNDHASQTINVTFGTASTPSATVGLRIPGGNAVASCWYAPFLQGSSGVIGGMGAQINIFASGASTPVTVFEF